MKRTKKQLQEEAVRLLIRKHVREMLKEGAGGEPSTEAEEEEAAADASTEPEAEEEPANEPTEEPTEPEDVQDEPGLEEELAELTDLYIKKLKNAKAAVDQSDMVEILSNIVDSFGYGNQDKLSVLQGVKEATIR